MWLGATRLYHADTLSYWRKRKNLPKKRAAVDPVSVKALSDAIARYYQLTEGRARHCTVECYRRGPLEYFFAFPEDYAQNAPEWAGATLSLQSRHPPFEIVFVWDGDDGRLDLHLTGDRRAVGPLQEFFAEHILKCEELPADPADNRVYDLWSLRRKDFQFTWDVASGIERVAVNKLRLTLTGRKNEKLTLEVDARHNQHAIHDLLEKLTPVLPASAYFITQVGMTASVKVSPTAPAKTVSFQISHPNSCSLKYDEIGLKLRAMLEASGIEPKPPEVEVASSPEIRTDVTDLV